jgi:acetyltransferase-like isoleucine patch superfamily enzyme
MRWIMRRFRRQLGKEMRSEFDRFLPLDEMIFRFEKGASWDKARLLGFGEGSVIHENSYVYGKPKVGKNVWIGPMTMIDGTGGLIIGDNCDISAGAFIVTHSTHPRLLTDGKSETVRAPVHIENNVYIGSKAVILPGVRIGHHSVIGAGAVVVRDVKSYSIMIGVPARRVGKVSVRPDGTVTLEYFKTRANRNSARLEGSASLRRAKK